MKIKMFVLLLFMGLLGFKAQSYQLSSHILDINVGKPAPHVPVQLEKYDAKSKTWSVVEQKMTDANGRIKDFLSDEKSNVGVYKLVFLVEDYFKKMGVSTFYPFIEVSFQITDHQHYHVPITLSPYGYSTYRGS